MDFPHCSDCLQLENIALGHLTTIYSRLNGVNNCCEMPQTIITAISVNKNDNDNKENYATDEDSACTMTLTVPNAIKKVVIFKNGKRSILLENIDAINKSYYFLTVLNLIQHLIFYSADNALGAFHNNC
jgi:hypothetical protein